MFRTADRRQTRRCGYRTRGFTSRRARPYTERHQTVVSSRSVRHQSRQTSGGRHQSGKTAGTGNTALICFVAQRPASKAVHGQASDKRRQSVYSQSESPESQPESRRAAGEPREPAGEPGELLGEPGEPESQSESPEIQPESPESYSESRRANRRAGELPESPESQPESPFRSAASFVFWTRSTHLGSAHGETTTGQQRQSTVAGRTLQ